MFFDLLRGNRRKSSGEEDICRYLSRERKFDVIGLDPFNWKKCDWDVKELTRKAA